MKGVSVFLICCISWANNGLSQVDKPLSPIENLLKVGQPVAEIASYNYIMDRVYEIQDAELPYIKGIHQFLLRNRNGLYMLVDGTGRLYKIERGKDGINYKRLDSTRFFGYNFGFVPFSYNDSIYSFGGYGFWKFNGQLRVFIDKRREWALTKLNTEIPFAKTGMSFSTLFWYNLQERKIYIGYSLENKEGLKNLNSNVRSDTVSVLDS